MHLRWLKRPFTAFISLWFLLAMVEPEAVHSCSVHSGAAAGAHTGHAGHDMSAGHGQSSHDSSRATCSCPGDCAGTTAFALPTAPARVSDAAIRVARESAFSLHSRLSSRVEFLLPFAIGPPAPSVA
jgi:hypothetical protein